MFALRRAAIVLLIYLAICCLSLRDGGLHPLVVDYHEYYYYKMLKEKMIESLSISNCTLGGDVSIEGDSHEADLKVKLVPPPDNVVQKWKDQKKAHRIFAHVSENLCSSDKYKDLKKGFYKRAKGCYKVFEVGKDGLRKKRFNDYGATLHPEHVRCENQESFEICDSGANGVQVVKQKFRELHQYPFLITAQNVAIGRGGMFAMPCGPFGLFSSCEAVKCGVPAANMVVPESIRCRNSLEDCPLTVVDRVFINTQYDDTQIGQFMQEALPKLVYHLDFLRKNKDVKIHFGFTKQPRVPDWVLPHNFFKALGLEDRLINGTFFAKQVYMPREGGCQDIGYNAWEVVTMREKFLKMAGVRENKEFRLRIAPARPIILILTRSAGTYTQNKADFKTRGWPQESFPLLLSSLRVAFPTHDIEVFSDRNDTLMSCPLCQAEAFNRADIVIGYHGAGLSNTMFMRPNGVVVEVVYHFDSRHAPIIGIFPRISAIIGLHHFTYYIKDIGLDVVKLANETALFARNSRLWA